MVLSYEKFTTNVTLNKEIPLNFGSHLDPKSIRIQTPDTDQILLGGGMRSLTALVCDVKIYFRYMLALCCIVICTQCNSICLH